jgi:hypothetical protein
MQGAKVIWDAPVDGICHCQPSQQEQHAFPCPDEYGSATGRMPCQFWSCLMSGLAPAPGTGTPGGCGMESLSHASTCTFACDAGYELRGGPASCHQGTLKTQGMNCSGTHTHEHTYASRHGTSKEANTHQPCLACLVALSLISSSLPSANFLLHH